MEKMMKKFLMASVVSFAMLGVAQAADLPSTSEPAFAPVAEAMPAFNWSGFYGGLNVGFGFGSSTPSPAAFGSVNGFLGGAQVGYNYQVGQIVAGIEADWQLSDMKQSVAGNTLRINNFGTVRARVGYAADRFMPYLTGGYAFANTDLTVGTKESKFHNGYVLGAGVEYAWTNNITTKLEGLYTSFEQKNFTNLGGKAGADAFVIRTGLNFKF
jgi:outer membrane immunogenic protein